MSASSNWNAACERSSIDWSATDCGARCAFLPASISRRTIIWACPRTRASQRMAAAVARRMRQHRLAAVARGARCFTQLERRFAAFKGTERALYFSSGYLANLAVLTTLRRIRRCHLLGRPQPRQPDRRRPPVPGATMVFPHGDAAALAALMAEETAPGQKFVVTESLFSMDGDIAPLAEYARLASAHGAALIVDDAHAVGIYGARGAGLSGDGVRSSVEHGRKGPGRGRRVRGRAGVGHRVSGPARASVHFFDCRAAGGGRGPGRQPRQSSSGEPWRRTQLLERAAYLRRAWPKPASRWPRVFRRSFRW